MGFFDKLRKIFHSDKKLDVDARFELLREAISGTMSKFYMARDRRSGQVFGLKIADADKTAAFEGRFKALNKPSEGEIAVSLKHPRVVETYEHGVTTKGLGYLVMEYLHGTGLHSLIHNRDPVLDGKRVLLIRQMAEAIEYLHRCEYIHRDVCPRNFICTPDAESLKLIDFGLTLPATKDFTQPGNRTGTPMYMAPEIIRRRATDQRVDIFALGVSAYQLCTFEFPWPVGENPALSAMAHDTDSPRDIRECRPDLQPGLAAAIMKCLAANPSHRPPTVTDFLHMIRDFEQETVE
jgi:eukaryotic-like serine/threonine-protein kinase